MTSDLRQALTLAFPKITLELARKECSRIFDAEGSLNPPQNYMDVADTYWKYKNEFLPLCPLIDPTNRKIKVILFNFPKLLNLKVKSGFPPKKSKTIVESIEAGLFNEDEYDFQQDRLQALFWIPDVIKTPDAIFKKKKDHGLVPADHVYIKVYRNQGSPVKVVFTQQVGRNLSETVIVTSYLTSRQTARKYVDGDPLFTAK